MSPKFVRSGSDKFLRYFCCKRQLDPHPNKVRVPKLLMFFIDLTSINLFFKTQYALEFLYFFSSSRFQINVVFIVNFSCYTTLPYVKMRILNLVSSILLYILDSLWSHSISLSTDKESSSSRNASISYSIQPPYNFDFNFHFLPVYFIEVLLL